MTDETQVEDAVATHEGTPPETVTPESSEQTESEQQTTTTESETKDKVDSETTDPWEGFELKAPDGHDTVQVDAFKEALKSEGVAPEGVQRALDKIVPIILNRQVEGLDAFYKEEMEKTKSDPDIGGDKFDENMAFAAKVRKEFGDEEVETLFKAVTDGGQGLGNIAALNRMFVKLGKAMSSESKLVTGRPAPAEVNPAKRVFANSDMND